MIALLYLVPLAILMRALSAREYSIVPDAETLAKSWPYYPRQTVTAIFDATKVCVEELASNIGLQARLFERATIWLYGVTALLICVRLGVNTSRAFHPAVPEPFAQSIGISNISEGVEHGSARAMMQHHSISEAP